MEEKEIFKKFFKIISNYQDQRKNTSVVYYKEQEDLKKILNLESASKFKSWDDIFYWIEQYLKYSVNTSNPHFFNRMWAEATLPSQLGDIIATITNTCSSVYESAPVSTLIEKYMIKTMLELVGFKNGEGQMTTGSSNANMIAMMIARNKILGDVKTKGLQNNKKLIAFVNEEAHYSMDKSANILGIGTDNLLKIPALHSGEMNVLLLEKQIQKSLDSGNIVFFVSATSGTTVRGAYDNIEKILKLREKYGFWLHVDGAWGGVVFLNEKLRNKFLLGLEKVDSFTFDFHKMLGLGLMCNMFLINSKKQDFYLQANCALGDTNYIFNSGENDSKFPIDLGKNSIQCGKKVDSLKLFLDWKYNGQSGMSKKIEFYYNLCFYAEEIIKNSDYLEIAFPRISFNICFRYLTGKDININEFNLKLKNSINKSGEFMVGGALVGEKYVIRLIICNQNTKKENISLFFDHVIYTGKKLLN